MTLITGYDPGLTTGVAWGRFSNDEPFKLVKSFNADLTRMRNFLMLEVGPSTGNEIVVAERFVLSAGNRHAAELTGVRVEGMLELTYDTIFWQPRSDKALVSDQMMKDNGYWVDKKVSNWTDGRDQNDAIKHILVWLMRHGHRPTIEMINPRSE